MVTTAEPLIARLKDLVECAVCLERFEDPRSLPCLHSFCTNCLEGLLGTGRKIKCPCCNKEVFVSKGVKELPEDFRAKSWLEILAEYEKAKEDREAELGEEGESNDEPEVIVPSAPSPEGQLLLNIHRNIEDVEALTEFLQHLIDIYESSACTDVIKAITTILTPLERYPHDDGIQVKGSCLLHRIIKAQTDVNLGNDVKRKIILVMMDALDNYRDDSAILQNACVVLIAVQNLDSKVFSLERLVSSLLEVIAIDDQDEVVRYLGILLIADILGNSDINMKKFVGDRGAIPIILKIIQQRLDNSLGDDTLEAAWTMLWNITDDSPVHSGRFITEGGMDCVLRCLQKFKGSPIIYFPLGLVNNISEVTHLRPHLQQKQCIRLIRDVLDSKKTTALISYQACSILAFLVSDGDEAWLLKDPSRKGILKCMEKAINRWDFMTELPFRYTTLMSIISLLGKYDSPECQHFALWAICNLTSAQPLIYCPMLEKESGLVLIKELLCDPRCCPRIQQLAQRISNNCNECHAEEQVVSDGIDNSISENNQGNIRCTVQEEPDTEHLLSPQKQACPVCQQMLTNLKNLSCGHSVCEKCAEFLLPVGGVTINCPTCSAETRVLEVVPATSNSSEQDQNETPAAKSFAQLKAMFETPTRNQAEEHLQKTSEYGHQQPPTSQSSPSFSSGQKPPSPQMSTGPPRQTPPSPPTSPRPSLQKTTSPRSPLHNSSISPMSILAGTSQVQGGVSPSARTPSMTGPICLTATSCHLGKPQAAAEAGDQSSPANCDRPQAGYGIPLSDLLKMKMSLKKRPK